MVPLIVGAGPVGLAAAVFLSRNGKHVRLIDAAEAPAPHSRALAVNPRTLELLESTGVTERMLAIGMRVTSATIWRGEQTIARMTLDGLHPKYPFMLALSQSVTERLLLEAYEKSGGRIERGCALLRCQPSSAGVDVLLKHGLTGAEETTSCPWLLAADGSKSTVRQSLAISFTGTHFLKPWHLADLPLVTSLPEDSAHIIFFEDGGFLFMIRVVGDTPAAAPPLWRVISNFPDYLDRLKDAKASGPPVWESSFHIAHRINEHLALGNIFFAGDAAHIHSPMGARGMNLGIEDAWVFAKLFQEGRLDQYNRLRRPVDAAVVRRVNLMSHLVAGESAANRWLRHYVLPTLLKIPAFQRKFRATASGLDHPLPS